VSTHPAVLCAGVAGAGRLAEQVALKGELESRVLAESILVVTDARTALEGAHCGSPGIVCIAGTGSMVLGRNASGEEARAGGWDPVLGDEGSAYWLVLESVRRACEPWTAAVRPHSCGKICSKYSI
jgi:N-acetylglucosamine kinase-like BadF-type ATPase